MKPVYNICHVVFSTNRPDYLTRTLRSLDRLSYNGHNAHHVFIDDYPLNRDTDEMISLARSSGFDEIIMHEENIGLTRTWQSFYDLIKDRGYDYIVQHEDDVELLYSVNLSDVISLLQHDNTLSQIQFKRNNWYSHEVDEVGRLATDNIFGRYRYEVSTDYFWSLFSVYPAWIASEPLLQATGHHPAEGVLAWYLLSKYNLKTGLLKTFDGDYMVRHIGDYSQGKRVVENEPGWDRFNMYDPTIKYCSKTGIYWNEN